MNTEVVEVEIAKPVMGRPKVRVNEKNVARLWLGVSNWIEQNRLAEWLNNGISYHDAIDGFNKLPSSLFGKEKQVAAFQVWCDEYLSERGWKRLLANLRQKDYVNGMTKDGCRKKNIQVKSRTLSRLNAKCTGKNMTINDYIEYLLDKEDKEDKEDEIAWDYLNS